MKLALTMITEGDHPNLKRAVKSVYKYVDRIFITTTKINKPQWEDPKIEWSYFPWKDDFSAARNFNFKQVPKDYSHIMWLDSDDIVEGAEIIPDVVMSMVENGLDAVFLNYNYDIDERGNVLIVHPRERIVRRDIYHWKGKLHETMIPSRKVRTSFIKDFTINHYPTKENKEGGLLRNLNIIQSDYESQRKALVAGEIDEIDPRTEYYLGRVLFDTHTDVGYKRAFKLFQDYIEHSGWDEERAFAWNYLGNIMYQFKDYKGSLDAYLSAIKERPEFPTWHINLSRSYAAMKDFDKAKHHVKIGVSMKQPKTAMILTPLEDRISSLTVLYYVWFHERDFKKALEASTMLYDIAPTKENREKIESVEKLQKWIRWSRSLSEMVKEMDDKRQNDRAKRLLDNLPDDISDTVYTDTLRTTYTKPAIWPEKSIAYYAAIDVHEWSPKDIGKGLGGSESAVYYLSRHWAKLGYKVVVYTSVGKDEGIYDGVEYRNFYRFNSKDKFDILVSWRNPHFIHKNLLDARLILLDLHDIPEIGEFDNKLVNYVDYIMVKSDYHRSLLPDIPDDKFKVVSNGIDWKMLEDTKGKQVPHSMFYGSSYDRGLEGLLEVWPEIRKEVPDATLHVAYGWELFDKLRGHVAKFRNWKSKMQKLMKQSGITHHGKLGHKELYKLAKSCSVWSYPTTFEEIDCITARYCQALGTVPVVYNYAALKTTVQRGVRLSVNPHDSQSIVKYKDALVKQLKSGDGIDGSLAKDWDWGNIAKSWVKVFNEPAKQDIKLTVFTPTIRSGFWNIMADNLSKQSYKNFEWLIVDDYPEDRQRIADKYAKKYGLNIRYMRGKKERSKYNYALIQADNMAIFNAKGSAIVWLQDFILLPDHSLQRIADIHRRHPDAIIAPVDAYYSMKHKPNLKNKEDWFDGKLDVAGKFIRENIRCKLGELKASTNPYDFEMNIGVIPTKVGRKLNGLWEFQDDGLGFNNTEIAMRALKMGSPILVDERIKATCLDLWEHIQGTKENVEKREWNLNDARYLFIKVLTDKGVLPIVRDSNLDRKIKLTDDMPDDLDQEGAAKWIQDNAKRLVRKWIEEMA